MKDGLIFNCIGFMRIVDKATGEILRSKKNAIHFENMSEALALAFAHQGTGHVHEMVFGNGGSEIQGTGVLFYRPPNVGGAAATLYNQTHRKVVDSQSPLNLDTANNFIVTRHAPNQNFSDVIITCTLGYDEPAGQEAFDTASGTEGNYVFDELGLKSYHATGAGKLLTHVVFHPVQKSLNRIIEIQYTIRLSASRPV